eukprot:NODE_167_length_14562_cov_0.357256.p1 type:complete len:444 gc:universal NODE_167_length_14562_cov_0.357256:10152-11483(+)
MTDIKPQNIVKCTLNGHTIYKLIDFENMTHQKQSHAYPGTPQYAPIHVNTYLHSINHQLYWPIPRNIENIHQSNSFDAAKWDIISFAKSIYILLYPTFNIKSLGYLCFNSDNQQEFIDSNEFPSDAIYNAFIELMTRTMNCNMNLIQSSFDVAKLLWFNIEKGYLLEIEMMLSFVIAFQFIRTIIMSEHDNKVTVFGYCDIDSFLKECILKSLRWECTTKWDEDQITEHTQYYQPLFTSDTARHYHMDSKIENQICFFNIYYLKASGDMQFYLNPDEDPVDHQMIVDMLDDILNVIYNLHVNGYYHLDINPIHIVIYASNNNWTYRLIELESVIKSPYFNIADVTYGAPPYFPKLNNDITFDSAKWDIISFAKSIYKLIYRGTTDENMKSLCFSESTQHVFPHTEFFPSDDDYNGFLKLMEYTMNCDISQIKSAAELIEMRMK